MVNTESNSPPRRDEGGGLEELEQLCARIQVDPWNLATYTKGIYISARMKHEKYLEFFRTQCVKHCVVEDCFWLSWIEDKRRDSSDDDLISMYECAVDNEPSVEIWIAYARFESKRNLPSVNTTRVRALFERGLKSVGLHALDGPLLWNEYRQFEQDLLNKYQGSELGSQIDRVRNLFFRQLQLPLAGLADVLDEYRVWESELPKEHRKSTTEGENIHKIGHEAWERRKIFELKVQCEFDEMLKPGNMNSLWNEYINFELQGGDLEHITILYMRALDDLGYERDDLWIRFSSHASNINEKFALWVCERSCRHMPRSVNIWINYLQTIASISSSSAEELVNVFDKAVTAITDTSGLISIHITAADCLHRHHPESIEAFRRILLRQEDILSKMGDLSSDMKGSYRLLTYWGKHELRLLMNKKGSYENYLEVIRKLFQRFITDYRSWLFVIDGVKNLDTSGNCSPEFVAALAESVIGIVENKCASLDIPKSAHELIVWLFESALQFVSVVDDVSEVYIDYVQTYGEVADIKRAHMTIASQMHNADTRGTGNPLSLHNIILRRDHRRRRHSETFSETSSDSGCCSHRFIKGTGKSRQDSHSISGSSPKLSVRDVEFATRATWDGHESAEPSIAPAVPPVATMPPPVASMPSKVISHFSMFSGNSITPDTSPDLKYLSRCSSSSASLSNFSMLPQPMISSHYGDVFIPGAHKRGYEEVDDAASVDSERSSRIQLLLSSDNDILQTWLCRRNEVNTIWISNLGEKMDEDEVTSILSSFKGFKSLRLFPSRGTCCIEFDTHEHACKAKEMLEEGEISVGALDLDISSPSSSLYEDKVLFVKRISDIVALNKQKITDVLNDFFKGLGHVPVCIRFPSTGADDDVGESHVKVPDYCYVDFKEDNSARSIINKILSRSGTLSCRKGDVTFDVSPSTPMFRKRARMDKEVDGI